MPLSRRWRSGGLPVDAETLDPTLVQQLELVEGQFDLVGGLVLGKELARALGVRLGDSVTLAALTGSGFAGLVPADVEFPVRGIFKSGFYEYDRGLIFTSLEHAGRLAVDGDEPVVGVKLVNRYRLNTIISVVDGLLAGRAQGGELVSWREYNRAFFGALRMEKLTMSLLIGVMFIVVAGNIYHSLRRGVQEKRTAVAVLRAMGAGSRQIQLIFVLEGFLIGLKGTASGIALGLLTATHIDEIFALIGQLSGRFGSVAITPATFYLTEVPVRLIPGEIFLIAAFALSAAVLSAWGASRDVASMRPSTILRYE